MHSTTNIDDGYIGSGDLLQASVKKYGKAAHVKQILEMLPSREALKLAEKALITEDLLKDRRCMNVAPGGGGGRHAGFTHDEATKQKIGKNTRSRDTMVREKISRALVGRTNDEHSARQLARFADKSNHPKTKTLCLTSPDGASASFVGYEAFYTRCKELSISATRLIKFFGSAVPDGTVKGGKTVTHNTIGWSLK
jgi:hypothetical protein